VSNALVVNQNHHTLPTSTDLLSLIFTANLTIMGDGSANEILQGRFIHVIAFAEINSARCLRLKASVEEALWILMPGSPKSFSRSGKSPSDHG